MLVYGVQKTVYYVHSLFIYIKLKVGLVLLKNTLSTLLFRESEEGF
jgi:hypothetical protein